MSKKKILIVDDEAQFIQIILNILKEIPNYSIVVATSGKQALNLVQKHLFDIILLDVMMPQMDGFEVCKLLKENLNTKDIPIIFITAKTDDESIEKAYELGGVDYITKPFRAREVLSRVANHLALSEYSHTLEDMVKEKTGELLSINRELEDTQHEVISTMGAIGERRSKETANHVKRVALYSELLAKYYGLNDQEIKTLKEASPMHDIGKIAIADNILNKSTNLTNQEFEDMKQHTTLGYEMLKYSSRHLLKMAATVAYEHHEKWDGTGYPNGLKGEEIHIYGRITALADVFDALGSNRVYKKAWLDEDIFKLLKEEKAKHFDPKLVEIFFNHSDEFLEIRNNLVDVY